MKFFLNSTIILATLLATVVPEPATAGVSISIGEPGFFGQVDIGNYPPPRLIYPEPVIVGRVVGPPIYLRVPPGQIRHWNRYCYEYGACGRPVYFIEDSWYNEVYIPRYREHHHDREYRHDHEYRHENRYDHDRGDRRYNY